MPAVWTYPWTLFEEGLESALDELRDAGVDGLKLASHYHSIQTVSPRTPDRLFESYPGGAYFEPDPTHFEVTPIEPPVNAVHGRKDSLGEIVPAANDAGFSVEAWVVCLHNTRLGSGYPEYRIRSVFGDVHDHALCPSHPEVREYYAGIAATVSEYDVSGIGLESIGFPNAFHGHGSLFGDSKNFTAPSSREKLVLSQCFCEGCREAAAGRVDMAAAKRRVRTLGRRILEGPDCQIPPLKTLVERHPELGELLEFRATVVTSLVERIAEAAGSTVLNYYLSDGFGRDPSDVWPAGVELSTLPLDRVTALCYLASPERAAERISSVQNVVDGTIDAGVTLDPRIVDSKETWDALSSTVREAIDGDIVVYNHGLATEAHLEWLAESFC